MRATRASAGCSARLKCSPARKTAAAHAGRQIGPGRPRPRREAIAIAFADIGFDVDIGPLFQTPEEAARQAVENDVHIVGVSSQAAGHKTLVPALIEALKSEGAGDILVVVGGVIPPKDYYFLRKPGSVRHSAPAPTSHKPLLEILSLIQKAASRGEQANVAGPRVQQGEHPSSASTMVVNKLVTLHRYLTIRAPEASQLDCSN